MIIFAVNIHNGGGKVLLDELLLRQTFGAISTVFCDQRYEVPKLDYVPHIVRVTPTLLSRLIAEADMRAIAKNVQHETVLCFGNLPPVFKLPNKTIVYLQNAFTIPGAAMPRGSARTILRSIYEKIWFSLFKKNASEFWVQTRAMKNLMEQSNFRSIIDIKPIFPLFPEVTRVKKKYDFIIVTNSNKHKRSEDFLTALLKLNELKKQVCVLVITDQVTKPQNDILIRLRGGSVHVEVKLRANRNEVFTALAASRTLVNASEVESFCLPLYEALHVKLNIITVDEPYAREAAPEAKFFERGDADQLATILMGELV